MHSGAGAAVPVSLAGTATSDAIRRVVGGGTDAGVGDVACLSRRRSAAIAAKPSAVQAALSRRVGRVGSGRGPEDSLRR